MKGHLSPRDLADVIDASESSIKRWIDEGRLLAGKTPGGHRRISVAEATRFIRAHGHRVLRPDLLGAEVFPEPTEAGPEDLTGKLERALLAGQSSAVAALVMESYLGGLSVAELCDGPLSAALRTIGTLWSEREDGIFVEHRATEICHDALRRLQAIQTVDEAGPTAIGAAGPADLHGLPSLMASTTLVSEGYQATNLGPMTPFASLEFAVQSREYDIIWCALSGPASEEDSAAICSVLEASCTSRTVFVVGGRGAAALRLPVDGRFFRANSMRELAVFAKGLRVHSASSRTQA